MALHLANLVAQPRHAAAAGHTRPRREFIDFLDLQSVLQLRAASRVFRGPLTAAADERIRPIDRPWAIYPLLDEFGYVVHYQDLDY